MKIGSAITAVFFILSLVMWFFFNQSTAPEGEGLSLDEEYILYQQELAALRSADQQIKKIRDDYITRQMDQLHAEIVSAKEAAVNSGHSGSTSFRLTPITNPSLQFPDASAATSFAGSVADTAITSSCKSATEIHQQSSRSATTAFPHVQQSYESTLPAATESGQTLIDTATQYMPGTR